MLSITKCKKILNTNGFFYTDEEIDLIRNVLYKLAEVCQNKNNNEVKKIKNDKN
jgi:hypothetical protein